MAKLFRQSTFLFALAVLLVLARAEPLRGHDNDHDHHDDDDDDHHDGNGGGDGCACNSNFGVFANKMLLLLKHYGSKELAPEIRNLGAKFAEYIIAYLAHEKPEEMNRVQGILQSSVKFTTETISKANTDH